MRLFSPAKVNLSLTILGKRADGYHDIDSVIQTVSFGDWITVERTSETTIQCNNPAVPLDSKNSCVQVLEQLSAYVGQSCYAHIIIEKNIPLQSGLGGGSSNAATLLRAANELFDLSLTQKQLVEIGASVSSDIPAILLSNTIHTKGRGEQVESLSPLPELWFVIVATGVKIATADAYAWWDENPVTSNSISYSPTLEWLQQTQNDFEQILFTKYPSLRATCHVLGSSGAHVSHITGSGGCVFGVFVDKDVARKTIAQFPTAYLASN